MIWNICLILIFVILAASAVLAVFAAKCGKTKNRISAPLNILAVGVFLAIIIGSFPVYYQNTAHNDYSNGIKAFMFSIHDTLQAFTLNSDVDFIRDNIIKDSTAYAELYSLIMSVLFILAPLIVAGVVISFAKNVSAYIKFLSNYFKEVYVFSELNERSLELGSDIKKNHKKAFIIYTDVFDSSAEEMHELLPRARETGSVYFNKDITEIKFKHHSKKHEIVFFIIGKNAAENTKQSIKLIEIYKNFGNTGLYVFSDSIETSLILTGIDKGSMKVRRVDEVQLLINKNMYENGDKIFERALKNHMGNEKYIPAPDERIPINAVIVGMGKHGTEMLKMLAWYCQMDGFRICIDAFEKDELAREKFRASCPELMSEKYNGVYVKGESEYLININSGIDVNTSSFTEKIKEIKNIDFIFISLGTDSQNIRTAVALRTICEQIKTKPIICTIVFDTDTKIALTDITIHDGVSKYDIDYIGDLKSLYVEDVIMNSKLEKEGLECHLKYCNDKDKLPEEAEKFWKYEYYYRSSIATAIHNKIKEIRKIPDENLSQLEHRRWNVYMRSEGYIFSGSKDKSSRNDLGKMHHDLVDYDSLPDSEKKKDERVSRIK